MDCPYFQPKGYNYSRQGIITLPRNLNQLNDYMCGPLNRKGLVCSECADGFGPSVTSFGYRCVKCTNSWYGVPLFLFLKFAPVAIFYLIVLVFQIRVISAPIPCLIICAQLLIFTFGSSTISNSEKELMFTEQGDIRLDMKIVFSLYQVFNLDSGQYFMTPYCANSRLKFIHIAFISYISAFIPILLICLTWLCIHLHGRNFRPLVWLWRPFHRYFVQLRRGWDTKSDIIDVFITFFFLTYSKMMYQTLPLVASRPIRNIEPSGEHFSTYVSVLDHSIDIGSAHHLLLTIPVILVSLTFNLLPLLLVLYPIQVFRSCFIKCRLNFIIMHTFLDKVYGCYRSGLEGGKDMRSFSGLYLFLGIMTYFTVLLSHEMRVHINKWFAIGTLLFVITLVVTIAKPYRKAYMNHLDTLLLSDYTIFCYVLSSTFRTHLLVARMLITAPITVFVLVMVSRKLYKVSELCIPKLKSSMLVQKVVSCLKLPNTVESIQSPIANTPTSARPLIQPTSSVICYGTTKDNN